jgi:hypothetical protein
VACLMPENIVADALTCIQTLASTETELFCLAANKVNNFAH